MNNPDHETAQRGADSVQRTCSVNSALYRVSLRDPIGSRYANRPQGYELHHVYIDAESRSDAVQKAARVIQQWMLATEADQCETFWARKDNIVLPSPNAVRSTTEAPHE